jgi:RNA polymerase sigma-70 factor (ECF subfamily)
VFAFWMSISSIAANAALAAEGAFGLRSARSDRPAGGQQNARRTMDEPDTTRMPVMTSSDQTDTAPTQHAEAPDHLLIQRFQSGDEKGYVELYVRRQAEVYTYCLRLSAGDRDQASDIFQDVWIKVYRKAHTFREGTNVIGWLYTITRTTFLNHRRQRAHVALDDAGVDRAELASTDRSMSPEFRTEQQTLKIRVEQAIARLPLEIREPFILREFDGFSYAEIADQLSITHGAVRQRIYRAKQSMRELLADLIDDDNDMEFTTDAAGTTTVRRKDHGHV